MLAFFLYVCGQTLFMNSYWYLFDIYKIHLRFILHLHIPNKAVENPKRTGKQSSGESIFVPEIALLSISVP